jgi:hypothetical protein
VVALLCGNSPSNHFDQGNHSKHGNHGIQSNHVNKVAWVIPTQSLPSFVTYIGLHVNFPLLLSDINQNLSCRVVITTDVAKLTRELLDILVSNTPRIVYKLQNKALL